MNKLLLFAKLARLSSPSVYSVYFFPVSFGLLLASPIKDIYGFLLLFAIGSITTRGAGCIISDIFDRDFDRCVERTKNRPLANDSLSIQEALLALIILSFFSFYILLLLPKTAVLVGVIASVMIALYPLMKRITYFPQLFLGFTINAGVLIGYATVHDAISFAALLMYLACCFWTLGYDTIYAFMDLEDDKKIGIRGMALLLEKSYPKFWFGFFYFLFILLFLISLYIARANVNQFQLAIILVVFCLMQWQIINLDINSKDDCMRSFQAIKYVGLFLMVACIF
jgi:4-hydroxybenzoate polyprenyltransferase